MKKRLPSKARIEGCTKNYDEYCYDTNDLKNPGKYTFGKIRYSVACKHFLAVIWTVYLLLSTLETEQIQATLPQTPSKRSTFANVYAFLAFMHFGAFPAIFDNFGLKLHGRGWGRSTPVENHGKPLLLIWVFTKKLCEPQVLLLWKRIPEPDAGQCDHTAVMWRATSWRANRMMWIAIRVSEATAV